MGYIVCETPEKLTLAGAILNEICSDFAESHSGVKIYGGIGRATCGVQNFRKSWHDARQALEISENYSDDVKITLFSELGIMSLLASSVSREELKDYCCSVLMPLIESDRLHGTEYVRTLEVYLQCNCSMVKSAESMYIHRNTMVYRIEKIRALLDIDFGDMTAKSECMNALRIMKHFSINVES
jgi:DNA-binding PucR family transcriptional regulator